MKAGNIFRDTLICFSKLCYDRKESAHFLFDTDKIRLFFYNEFHKYPVFFKTLDEGLMNYHNTCIMDQFDNLKISRLVEWTTEYYEPAKEMHKFYDRVENKKMFNKIGRDFYNKLRIKS